MVEFGAKLRQLRKNRNLTQQQLADLIGVKNSVISFYEVGDRVPSPEVLRKLAVALHVSADYLLGIERSEALDVSGLDEQDRLAVQMIIGRLREMNKNSASIPAEMARMLFRSACFIPRRALTNHPFAV